VEGDDNSDDIIAAITRYKETHGAAEMEKTIHAWYDRFDQVLAAAIQEHNDLNGEVKLTSGAKARVISAR